MQRPRGVAAQPLQINTRSHESSVRTQGHAVLVIYTSKMLLIRYFWLLDTPDGTSVEVNSRAQGLLDHKVGGGEGETLPSQTVEA